MAQLLLDIKAEVEGTPPPTLSLPPQRLAHYEGQYDLLIAKGLAANPPSDTPSEKTWTAQAVPAQEFAGPLTSPQIRPLGFYV
jgi:hypothetical protein